MKKINIYLNKNESLKLTSICNKYQVSKSTIAEWVLFYLTKYLRKQEDTETMEKMGTIYIRRDKGSKTCIKPKEDPINNGMYKNLSKAYTNALHLHISKAVKNYLTEQNLTKYYNELNNKLQTIEEPNWDYNRFVRTMWRYEKKKKILKETEDDD